MGRTFDHAGGESPRELQARVIDWARTVSRTQSAVIAITHKGVIKATLGLACGWNLTSKAPVRLDWSRAHRFRFVPETGDFVLEEPNVSLEIDG